MNWSPEGRKLQMNCWFEKEKTKKGAPCKSLATPVNLWTDDIKIKPFGWSKWRGFDARPSSFEKKSMKCPRLSSNLNIIKKPGRPQMSSTCKAAQEFYWIERRTSEKSVKWKVKDAEMLSTRSICKMWCLSRGLLLSSDHAKGLLLKL